MSRLDGIAARLNLSRAQAKRYTRRIRDHFDEAPSYAIILDVLRHSPTRKPSPIQVVTEIKKRDRVGTVRDKHKLKGRKVNGKGSIEKGRPSRRKKKR